MATATKEIEQLAINTIRTLSMDAVQAANSGHPGTPMALAPAAYLLFQEVIEYDPAAPTWPARDRFVLSCGHASMLLYSMLHLAEVRKRGKCCQQDDEASVTLEQIRQFRQLGSRCPGHPEFGHTRGVETTTGPLGQGVANSVGMAIASEWLAASYDRPGFDLFGFNVYALCSDGDLMEGIGGEAASLAAHLKLSNLCWIYDDNKITIEGETSLAFSEDVPTRFKGYGWNVVEVDDANDLGALRSAIGAFHATTDRPTLIVVRSVIAWGAPNKANTADAHGAPLGDEEIRLTKRAYGWPDGETFHVPDEVLAHFREGIGQRGRQLSEAWYARFEEYKKAHPDLAEQVHQMIHHLLPDGWDADVPEFPADAKGDASRNTSGKVLNAIAKNVPWLLGGSADLAPSTKTLLKGTASFGAGDRAGRNLHFGVREHAMAGISNGMALCGLRPYAATFFVFADYLRPSMRLSAMMGLPVLYVFTHDSIGVGEDGPTHQPVEQLACMRATPNTYMWRPADSKETAAAYIFALKAKGPSVIALSRQTLPLYDETGAAALKGAYVLKDFGSDPEVILIGTGSEVELCVNAAQKLYDEGVSARVVSMPCVDLFEEQDDAYKQSVLPDALGCRVVVEAGASLGWHKYAGPKGEIIALDHFGASGPAKQLFAAFGFTAENVAAKAKATLAK